MADETIDPSQGAASAPDLSSAPQMPSEQSPGSPQEQDMDAATSGPQASQPGSRLGKIMQAIAGVTSTALAGIPAGGRPSFAGGLGQGARAGQAAQAVQQDIKFKTFDDQVRAANLHNQDLELQQRTQAQQDAHQKAQEDRHDWLEANGQDDDTIPNTAGAVTDYLKTQTASNGAASIPAGTHLTADGKSIVVPQDTQATRDAQLKQYNTFGPALGLPALPEGAKFVPPKQLDILTHSLQGYGVDGHPINPQELPGRIAAMQAQRDNLASSGAQPAQLKALDNVLGIYKANLKADNDQQGALAQSKKQGEVNAENSPTAIQGAGAKAGAISNAEQANKLALQQNAQDVKPVKDPLDTKNTYTATDKDGNQVAGSASELKAAGIDAGKMTKLEGSDASKVITARQLTSPSGLFSLINQDMRELDAKGKMGSAATSRLNDALLEKAGSDPDFAPLFTHTHLLATALMQAHVGSKGSENIMDEFKNLANAGKMSAPTLRAALGAEYKYVSEKAMRPKVATPSPTGGQ